MNDHWPGLHFLPKVQAPVPSKCVVEVPEATYRPDHARTARGGRGQGAMSMPGPIQAALTPAGRRRASRSC
jgi:hypothetical protein